MISISRTFLPPLETYTAYLKKIWKSHWLTNNGVFVQELEKKLAKRWGVKHVVCVANGTSALMIALKALGIKKTIYTSPLSFVATVSAPMWLGIKPVFVDEGETFPGPALVTHTYGYPHLVSARPVIYDASHAFGVKVNGKSLLSYGDVSIISFSAVKIFQTVEGGAVVTNNDAIARKARYMRNYGFDGRYTMLGEGMNAKMSEFHAAMGLCSLTLVDRALKRYTDIITQYNTALGYDHEDVTYYPIWYQTEKKLIHAIQIFEKHGIAVRRYFYPPLNKAFGGKSCPRLEHEMKTVLCLPLYAELTDTQVKKIIRVAKETR